MENTNQLIGCCGSDCEICGNIIHSMGETVIQCHGMQLQSPG